MTAARSRCCASATSAAVKIVDDRDPADARLLAGLDAGRQRLLLHALSEAREKCRPARSRITAASSSITSATIPRTISRSSATGVIAPIGPASISLPTVAGWWSASRRGGPRARCTSIDIHAGRDGIPQPPIAVAAGEDARFDVVEALDDRIYLLTTSGAPRGRTLRRRSPASGARPLARGGPRRARCARARRLFSRRAWRSVSCATRLRACRSRRPSTAGEAAGEVPLPGLGALTALPARATSPSCSMVSPASSRRPRSSRSSWAPRRRAWSGALSRRRSIRQPLKSSG